MDRDCRQILKLASDALPGRARIRASKEAIAHGHKHDLGVFGIHCEAVHRAIGGQTAHFEPPSETVGTALQPRGSAGIEKDPAHARRDVHGS
jgi:hypothetical protein